MVVRISEKSVPVESSAIAEAVEAGETVVLDFSATWCGPCQKLYPCLQALAKKYPSVHFYKLDVDDEDDEAFMDTYKVSSLPTLILLKKGTPAKMQVGFNAEALVDSFFELLSAQVDTETLREDIQKCFA